MRVDYIVLADAVAVAEGKHYIHGGGWDTLFAKSFPAIHPVLGAAVRLRIPREETNQPLAVEVDVLGDEGRGSILSEPLRGIVDTERPPHIAAGDDLLLHLALSFTDLQFDGPGTYTIVLRIDGQPVAQSRFSVMPVPEASA